MNVKSGKVLPDGGDGGGEFNGGLVVPRLVLLILILNMRFRYSDTLTVYPISD
jgi:hypothetical protein